MRRLPLVARAFAGARAACPHRAWRSASVTGGSLACVPNGPRTAIGVDRRRTVDLKARFPCRDASVPRKPAICVLRPGRTGSLARRGSGRCRLHRRASCLRAGAEGLRQYRTLLRPDSIILIHDTLPLDEVTQRPEREKGFYTGDVWKIVPCLRALRPDLEVFTIATPSSGLTVVAGLDRELARPFRPVRGCGGPVRRDALCIPCARHGIDAGDCPERLGAGVGPTPGPRHPGL